MKLNERLFSLSLTKLNPGLIMSNSTSHFLRKVTDLHELKLRSKVLHINNRIVNVKDTEYL